MPTIYPDCMMPDGAEPCGGYRQLYEQHTALAARLAEAEAAAKVWENEAERRARRYEKAEAENTRLRQEVNVYRESLGKQPLDDERPWEMRTDSATQRETAP